MINNAGLSVNKAGLGTSRGSWVCLMAKSSSHLTSPSPSSPCSPYSRTNKVVVDNPHHQCVYLVSSKTVLAGYFKCDQEHGGIWKDFENN